MKNRVVEMEATHPCKMQWTDALRSEIRVHALSL